jgi:hypothetical protein
MATPEQFTDKFRHWSILYNKTVEDLPNPNGFFLKAKISRKNLRVLQ